MWEVILNFFKDNWGVLLPLIPLLLAPVLPPQVLLWLIRAAKWGKRAIRQYKHWKGITDEIVGAVRSIIDGMKAVKERREKLEPDTVDLDAQAIIKAIESVTPPEGARMPELERKVREAAKRGELGVLLKGLTKINAPSARKMLEKKTRKWFSGKGISGSLF